MKTKVSCLGTIGFTTNVCAAISDLEEEAIAFAVPSKQDQLADGLISLSIAPRTKWQTLLNLDTIRVGRLCTIDSQIIITHPFYRPAINRKRRQKHHRTLLSSFLHCLAQSRASISLSLPLAKKARPTPVLASLLLA